MNASDKYRHFSEEELPYARAYRERVNRRSEWKFEDPYEWMVDEENRMCLAISHRNEGKHIVIRQIRIIPMENIFKEQK